MSISRRNEFSVYDVVASELRHRKLVDATPQRYDVAASPAHVVLLLAYRTKVAYVKNRVINIIVINNHLKWIQFDNFFVEIKPQNYDKTIVKICPLYRTFENSIPYTVLYLMNSQLKDYY